jgi:ACS family hexuronate transporter-like MFS transporter
VTTCASRLRIPGLRWWIVGMLFLAAVLNYIDRSLLGLLAPTIQKDLGISDGQYAQIVNAFLIASPSPFCCRVGWSTG